MSLSFKEFLNEAVFKAEEFTKKISKKDKGSEESITYGKAVINKLVNGEPVKLGKDGKAGEFDIRGLSNDLRGKLESLTTNKNLESDPESAVERFDRIINGIDPDSDPDKNNTNGNPIGKKLPKRWTNIFKGDFSGNPEGLSTKGHNFEEEFLEMINAGIAAEKAKESVSKEFEQLKSVIGKDVEILGVKHDGGNNTKRPFNFDGKKIWIGNDPAAAKGPLDIGKVVSDITVNTSDGPVYLSLKFGSTNAILNLGVGSLFPKSFFEGKTRLSDGGRALFKCLHIDEEKFKETFVSYTKTKADKTKSIRNKNPELKPNTDDEEIVDNFTSELRNDPDFNNLILQAFGFGYILVHKSGGKNGVISYRDFRKKETVSNFIKDDNRSKIEKAQVLYGGKSGDGKRVQVEINYGNVLDLSVVIRNVQGKVYPDKLQIIYKFRPEQILES